MRLPLSALVAFLHIPVMAAVATAAMTASYAGTISTVPITVVYPSEGLTMPMASGELVLGSVSRPRAAFRINGNPVTPYKNGGFIAFAPIIPGTFTFLCELDLPGGTTTYARTIFVAQAAAPTPAGPLHIDAEARLPSADVELRPGDWLYVQARGSPGRKADFGFAGGKRRLPMAEVGPASGLYQGQYQIRPEDALDAAEVEFRLADEDGASVAAKAKGKVTARADAPTTAFVRSSGTVVVKTGPGEGYMLFPPYGTRFVVSGRQGSESKVQLSPSLSGWTEAANLQFLPAGAFPPKATLGTIKTTAGPDGTSVSLGLDEKIPFSIDEADDASKLVITLYYAIGHTSWIVYDSSDAMVRQAQWRQLESNVVEVTLSLDPREPLWGYHASWDSGGLRVDLRRPPAFDLKAKSAFKGRSIALDPGHMPGAPGAVGPRGVLEKDVNLGIAKALETLLLQEGAKPILTRSGDEEVSLAERPRLAWERRGEIFVSIHNNAIPDGENPFDRPRGFSVFYYHPHSMDLGRRLHDSYLRRIPLADEGLRYGNLLVARATEMPAVLIESAYMIFPEQEALLVSPAFQRRLARAILEGLRSFLEAERARQRRLPRPKKAGPLIQRRNR